MAKELMDSLEFDTSNGQTPDVALATGTIYAIVYEGPDNDIWVKTVSVDSDGVIGSVLDSLEIDSGTCRTPRIIPLADGYLVIVYTGTSSDGFLATISVDGSGNIALVDTWEFDTGTGYEPFIFSISGTIYAITYDSVTDGYVKTLTISNTGTITKSWIDTLILDTVVVYGSYACHISGDIWAVVHRSSGWSAYIRTFEIDSSGNIGAVVIDSFQYADDSTVKAQWAMIVPVAGTIYAITYIDIQPAPDTCELFTIDIQNDGMIAASVTDSYQLSADSGGRTNIALYDTNVFLITFHTGWLVGDLTAITIEIEDDGTIGAVVDSLVIAVSSYNNRQLETATSKIWLLVSQGAGSDGWLYTMREVTFIPKIMMF